MKHLSPFALLLLACNSVATEPELDSAAVCQDVFACLETCTGPDCYACRDGSNWFGDSAAFDLDMCSNLFCYNASDRAECRATHCGALIDQCEIPGVRVDEFRGHTPDPANRCYDIRVALDRCNPDSIGCLADAIFRSTRDARKGFWEWFLYAHQECNACDLDHSSCQQCWARTDSAFPGCFPAAAPTPTPSDDCRGLSGVAFCLCASNYDYSACEHY